MRDKEYVLPQNGYKAPAVHRAFELLRMIAVAPHGMRMAELASRLGYSNSTTHGLVHTLLKEKALIRGEDTHELFLGPAMADLAFTNWNYVKVNEAARPVLEEIRDRADATVFLGVRISMRVMITATAEARDLLKISASVGTSIPLLAGATGKVFLAQETEEAVVQLLGQELPQFTPRSIVRLDEYLAELDRVRLQGYAIDDEEYLSGVRAVAVALNNRRGLPMAIWVVGIAAGMGARKLTEIGETTAAFAKRLCSELELPRRPEGNLPGPDAAGLHGIHTQH